MIERVACGFQTGVDVAAARAARNVGFATTGFMPRGWLTEKTSGNGVESHPEYAERYGAAEHSSQAFPDRTRDNLALADTALVLDGTAFRSPGTKLVCRLVAEQHGRTPLMVVKCWKPDGNLGGWAIENPAYARPEFIADWLVHHHCKTLFIGGNRESSSPGLGAFVEAFLGQVFRAAKGK